MRRPPPVKQPAYQRPSIDLSPVNREWREVDAVSLIVDDVVAQFGKIVRIEKDTPSKWVVVNNVDNVTKIFMYDDKVLAFVRR